MKLIWRLCNMPLYVWYTEDCVVHMLYKDDEREIVIKHGWQKSLCDGESYRYILYHLSQNLYDDIKHGLWKRYNFTLDESYLYAL